MNDDPLTAVGPVTTAILEGLLTQREVAQWFSVRPTRITTWRELYALPHVVIRGSRRDVVRYPRDEVVRWANENGIRLFLVERDEPKYASLWAAIDRDEPVTDDDPYAPLPASCIPASCRRAGR